MTADEAIALVEQLLKRGRLSNVQALVLRQAWARRTYLDIAKTYQYDAGHLKDVGSELWQSLSRALNQKVTKNTFAEVLQRTYECRTQPFNGRGLTNFSGSASTSFVSWGEAVDVSTFYGRTEDLRKLSRWLTGDRCRLVALLGMGGIGKTALSVKLAQRTQYDFQFVIWRSIKDAPPLHDLLQELVKLLSSQQEVSLPQNTSRQISRFIEYLHELRCLIVLDNFDVLLESGQRVGNYRSGYESYEELLQQVATVPHSSCLLLTSREKPAEIAALEGERSPVQSFHLPGLEIEAGHSVLKEKGLFGSSEQIEMLVQCYKGNPLALKIAANSILELFDGNIAEFLQQGTTIFDGIRKLLERQFCRLSPLEIQVMYWLAINRESVTGVDLQADIFPKVPRTQILAALESLRWRSLVERTKPESGGQSAVHFTQQPVIMEYVTDRLIEQMQQELISGEIQQLNQYALIKAQAKDYIRESQTRLILNPIASCLCQHFTSLSRVAQHCRELIETLRQKYRGVSGYAAGNLVNLLRHLNIEITGYNFSQLAVWQAYLQGLTLHQVNFSEADLAHSRFSNALTNTIWVEFSPDGSQLATSDANGAVRLWNVMNGQEKLHFEGHSSWSWAVRFSPDGRMLASCSGDYTIRLWDTATALCLQTLTGHMSSVWAICFSPEGTRLASLSLDQTVRIWEIKSGQCLCTIQETGGRSVAFSPDGKLLALIQKDQATIVLWDVAERQIVKTLSGHAGTVWSLVFSSGGEYLASGSEDQTVRLWNVDSGNCQQVIESNTMGSIWSVAFTPDGQTLGFGTDVGLVALLDVKTKHVYQTLQGHTGHLWSIAFSSDGKYLASSAEDQTIRLWRVETGQCVTTLQGYNGRIRAIASKPDGQLLASAVNQTTMLWDTLTGRCLAQLDQQHGEVYSVAFSPDGNLLATACNEGTVRIWNANTHQCLQTFQAHIGRIFKIAFHPNQPFLVTAGSDSIIRVWDVVTFRCIQTLKGHTGWIFSTAFSSDGRNLASGSDGEIKFWDVKTWQCVRTIQGHHGWVWTLAFSPDNLSLASGGFDQTICLWDLKSWECQQTLTGHTKPITDLLYTSDGDRIVSSSRDQTIRIWNLKTGSITSLVGHTGWVWAICLKVSGGDQTSPVGQQTLISGSQDETIRHWNIDTAAYLDTWRPPRPYEGMDISNVSGLTNAQKATLKALGAVDNEHLNQRKL